LSFDLASPLLLRCTFRPVRLEGTMNPRSANLYRRFQNPIWQLQPVNALGKEAVEARGQLVPASGNLEGLWNWRCYLGREHRTGKARVRRCLRWEGTGGVDFMPAQVASFGSDRARDSSFLSKTMETDYISSILYTSYMRCV